MAAADRRYGGTQAMIRKSLAEERKAVRDYGKRAAAAKSPAAKEAFEHNRADEREHAARLKRLVRYGDPVPDRYGDEE